MFSLIIQLLFFLSNWNRKKDLFIQAAKGPKNGLVVLERCLPLSFWVFQSTFAKLNKLFDLRKGRSGEKKWMEKMGVGGKNDVYSGH